jgi:hypothetical protein
VFRVLVVSDLHTGHKGGLTPPRHLSRIHDETGFYPFAAKTLSDWYYNTLSYLKPIDLLVCNGDAIDGKGKRNGGIEQFTTSREEQVSIAEELLKYAEAKQYVIVQGTPYHTGEEENWERVLASNLEGKFGSHVFIEHAGVIIDFRHKIGSSVIPHGRHTAAARDALWNRLHSERGTQPRADILIRSHVHYHVFSGDGKKLVITTPALQVGSDYGDRACSGTIDLGLIVIDIEDNGRYSWRPILIDMAFTSPQTIQV